MKTINCIQCPVFKNCLASVYDIDELQHFQEHISQQHFKNNEIIFRENQLDVEMFMLVTGNIKLTKEDGLPYTITVGIVQSGEMIGLEAINNERHPVTSTSITDSTVCIFNKWHIDNIIRQKDTTCQFIISKLLNQTRQMYNYLLIMVSGNSTSKVAQAILTLLGNDKTIEITKEEIALMTGSSRETVSRTLSIMRQKKLIETNLKIITVLNRGELILLTKKTKRK